MQARARPTRARPMAAAERAASDGLDLQLDDFRPQLSAGHADTGDRDRQPEAARTGAAWIEKQDAFARLDRRLVRVSIHHRSVAGGSRVEPELRNVMQHVE